MIRFLIICIIVVGFLILTIPLLPILWLIGKKRPDIRDIASLRAVQAAFRLILRVSGLKLTVIGEENIPKDTAVLYVGNHRSYFDILITCVRFPTLGGFVAKKEMDRYPLLNIWMRRIHCLFLDRNDLRQGMETIKSAISLVQNGISVFIFPEGTRNREESELDLMPFHEGSFRVSTRSGCPIIPVSLCNTQEIFEAHLPKVRPTHVILEYGSPIYPAFLSRDEQKHLGETTRSIILETLKKNEALLS